MGGFNTSYSLEPVDYTQPPPSKRQQTLTMAVTNGTANGVQAAGPIHKQSNAAEGYSNRIVVCYPYCGNLRPLAMLTSES